MTQDIVQKSNRSSPFIHLMDVSDSVIFTLSIVMLNQMYEESHEIIMEYIFFGLCVLLLFCIINT